MRLLVAGRRAKAVARAAGAFADDLTIETAATKVAAIALLERAQFDLVLACEKLDDGSGLEVLSHVAVNAPNTLRIFAARPSTLNLLKTELGFFGLFGTLPYPINFRKVWSVIDLVRSCCVEWELAPRPRRQTARRPAETPHPTGFKPDTAVPGPRRPAAAGASPGPRQPTRIPESEAFKRALARRNEAKRRRDLSATNESLAQLARLVTAPSPTPDSRATRWGRKRTALFVGSGVFAAGTVVFLTFFMLSGNNSIGRSAPPFVASSDQPVSEKVLPWQAPTPQPTPQLTPQPTPQPTPQLTHTTFVPSDTAAPTTADMEVQAEAEAEAEFERLGNQTGYPSPPPPNPPAGPSEPPPYDASGTPIER